MAESNPKPSASNTLSKEVQERVDETFGRYTENDDLKMFDILHLYPDDKQAYPDGFIDCRFFDLVGFNTTTMEKHLIGRFDGLRFIQGDRVTDAVAPMKQVVIFADGSTCMQFTRMLKVEHMTQMLYAEVTNIPSESVK
jgi:hypothetical protein